VTQPLSAQLVPAARRPERAVTRDDFGDFYERWHAQLLDYVKFTCGVRDADEITQETMARALVNLDLSSDHGRQWRWLRVVARNVATDLGRARRYCDVASDAPCDVERVAGVNVEQQLLDSECLQELHHVLTALSPKQSQAWWLTIAEGMSPTAIAATLECSPESVRQALFKTRRKLASSMATFVERAEGFGAIGVVAVLLRRARAVTRPVTRVATPAPLALAAVGVVGTLAMLSVPAHLGGTTHKPVTRHPALHVAAETTATHVGGATRPPATAKSAAGHATSTATHLRPQISRPTTSTWVSAHPLSTGRTLTVRVQAPTPAGELTFQQSFHRTSQTGVVCHRTSALTCN
jgi:RNA polymerase sigma factor (sigma-70 family)